MLEANDEKDPYSRFKKGTDDSVEFIAFFFLRLTLSGRYLLFLLLAAKLTVDAKSSPSLLSTRLILTEKAPGLAKLTALYFPSEALSISVLFNSSTLSVFQGLS